MKKRPPEQSPPVSPPDYGRSLRGLGFNLLVADVPRAVRFATGVLGATSFYDDVDFAALKLNGGDFMFHADHTYDRHPLHRMLAVNLDRGIGSELRLNGRDPDEACAAADRLGCKVLEPATTKGHGTREAYILDPEGYLWVPTILS